MVRGRERRGEGESRRMEEDEATGKGRGECWKRGKLEGRIELRRGGKERARGEEGEVEGSVKETREK